MGLVKNEKKEHARLLYINERITFKEIAERVGVGEKTVSRWCKSENWDKLRQSLLTTRETQLTHWYNQLDAINSEIAHSPEEKDANGKKIEKPPKNIPTSAEADIMTKIDSNIQKLEVEISLGEYVEVGRKMLTFIQAISLQDAKLFKSYFDEFINAQLTKN